MNGVLLAAGLGVRMRPLTRLRAKPALPLLNRPLFAHGLAILRKWGCSRVVMNLHHKPGSVLDLLERSTPEGLDLEISPEEDLLGTAGALKRMEGALRGGPFWVLNADSLSSPDTARMARLHRDSGALVTMALRPWSRESGYSPVEIDPEGRVVRIAGRPEGAARGIPHIFIGVQLVEDRLLDSIPSGEPCETMGEIYPGLIEAGAPMMGFVTGSAWLEVGNPEAYRRGNLELLRAAVGRGPRELRPLLEAAGNEGGGGEIRPEGPILLGSGARLAEGVVIEAGAVLGSRVAVEAGSRLCGSVIWDGSRIGTDSVLEECLVAGTELPAGSRYRRKIVLPDPDRGLVVEELEP